jgi:hypothetical protein
MNGDITEQDLPGIGRRYTVAPILASQSRARSRFVPQRLLAPRPST